MWRWVIVTSFLLSACGLRKYLPEGPAVSGWERATKWPGTGVSGADYTGPAKVGFPVIPMQIWGLAYDLDLVIVSRHPEWNMHEYAMVRTPDGPLWLCKDARESDLSQSIVADLEGIEGWLPEVPVARKQHPVVVRDESTGDWLDIHIEYDNIDGQPVVVDYTGPAPTSLQGKRNGSTMGHSRSSVLAVLDLSHRDFARRAEVTIGGERQRISRLMGLVPFRMALQQVQGGLSVGRFTVSGSADEVTTTHDTYSGDTASQTWTVQRPAGEVVVEQAHRMRTVRYRFADRGHDTWELRSATVEQWGRATPAVHMELHPPLPDLRRPFEGTVRSHYVIDINGQEGHAVGWLSATWRAHGVELEVAPEAPWWTTDRPMKSTVTFDGGEVEVRIETVPQ